MSKVTASDIVRAIGHLPRNRDYNYINPATRTKIVIVDVVQPEGPITIGRYNPTAGPSRRLRNDLLLHKGK